MSKIIVCDLGSLTFQAIFGSYSQQKLRNEGKISQESFIMPSNYLFFMSLISLLRRVGVSKEDSVLLVGDGKNSWRKIFDKNYKAQREGFRQKFDINWQKEYSLISKTINDIDQSTDFHIIWLNSLFNGLDLINTPEGEKYLNVDEIDLLTEYSVEADDVAATCLLGNTYIASPIKKASKRIISAMKVGDKVYAYDTTKNQVVLSLITRIFKRKVNELYEIYFNNNTKLRITGNHPLYRTNNQWVKAKDLKVGNEIYHINTFQGKNYVLFKPKIATGHTMYQLGYLCGAIEGDGHFDDKRKKIEFNINDKDFVYRIRDYLKLLFNYPLSWSRKGNQYRINIGNNIIYETLKHYAINKKKASPQFKRGYIAGYFDAEGNLYYHGRCWRISMTSINRPRLKWIQKELTKFGFSFKMQMSCPNRINPLYILLTTQNTNLNFFTYFNPAIFRKYPNFKESSLYLQNGLKITKIKKKINYKRGFTVYNLEVENQNNYFANNLLVHNCCKVFKDKEIILVTKDLDWSMLCVNPNVKFFSMNTKYKGGTGVYKQIDNGYKVLEKKIRLGDVSDNILVDKENDTERDKEIRKLIIDLINLPEWVTRPIENILKNLPQKTCDFSKLPFQKSLALRFPSIYSPEKIITYDECIKRLERKELIAKNKKLRLKKEKTLRKIQK